MNKLLTPKFRVSFPQVFEAKAFGNQDPKFSVVMLWNVEEIKKNPQELQLWNAMQAALKEAATERWGAKVGKIKLPFRKGEEKDLQGYGEGIVFATASSKTRPGLVDQKLQRIIEPGDFYAGCYARATVNPYCWENMGKRGASLGLQNLQKAGDGSPFSGRSAPEQDFDAIAVDDDAEKEMFGSEEGDDLLG